MRVLERRDWDLIAKYDKSGPRYTSYPSTPWFSAEIGAEAYREALDSARNSRDPLSLYLHIPFCRTLCWYCGCNMVVNRKKDRISGHLAHIHREIAAVAVHVHPDRPVDQLHFGGGTPNMMSDYDLSATMKLLRERFRFTQDAEISMELDPRTMRADFVKTMVSEGFNRVSLGVQDFDLEVQTAVNRIQPYEMVAKGVETLRREGLRSLNMDLIYGLPRQSPESFRQTLAQVAQLGPERIALFNFAFVPWMKKHQLLLKQEELPEARVKLEMMRTAIEFFEDAGYVYIGMDHFAKPSDPLAVALAEDRLHRNFQGYTTRPGLEMLAFGMSAISMLDGLYVQNHGEIREYEKAVKADMLPIVKGMRLSSDDRRRRQIIQQLMCNGRIRISEIEALCEARFDTYFPNARQRLEELTEDGLLLCNAEGYQTTFTGQLLLRNVAMIFDQYLENRGENGPRFSRTI